MRCEDCPERMVPFFICKDTGWPLRASPGFWVIGCNIDGVLPPTGRSSLLKMQDSSPQTTEEVG